MNTIVSQKSAEFIGEVLNWTRNFGCVKILILWGRFVPGGAPGLQIQWKAWLTCLRWVRFPHAPAKPSKNNL
ncbi:MAG TPA: hypothetical protein DCG84_02930 [Peptococcaceae bacterium]|nr:hypothetical protein [Peptococcaceae bacterium]